MIQILRRNLPVLRSAIFAVFLSYLGGTAVTALMVLGGLAGFEPHNCSKSQGDPEFGSVSWYMEGYDCLLQWEEILGFSVGLTPPFLLIAVVYVAHRYALVREREQQQERRAQEEALR